MYRKVQEGLRQIRIPQDETVFQKVLEKVDFKLFEKLVEAVDSLSSLCIIFEGSDQLLNIMRRAYSELFPNPPVDGCPHNPGCLNIDHW